MTATATYRTPTYLKTLVHALMLTLLIALFGVSVAWAQEYKEAYNAGLEAAKAKQYEAAYTHFEQAVVGAREADDQDVIKMSTKVLTQLDKARGNKALKAEDYETAKAHFEKGIAHKEDYAYNYYGLGLALKNLDDIEGAMAAFQKAVEVGNAMNSDRKTARIAEDAIRNHFYYLASSAVSKRNATAADAAAAREALAQLTEYVEPDADYHYYLAVAHNIVGEHGAAVAEADKALALHNGSKTEAAKLHFVRGEALLNSGDKDGARTAFQNATFGNYKASAEHYLSTL